MPEYVWKKIVSFGECMKLDPNDEDTFDLLTPLVHMHIF